MRPKVRSVATGEWNMTIEARVDLALRELTPPEERILRERFGIGDTIQEMRSAVAPFPLTSRAAQRIEECALRKLRLSAIREAHSQRTGTG